MSTAILLQGEASCEGMRIRKGFELGLGVAGGSPQR